MIDPPLEITAPSTSSGRGFLEMSKDMAVLRRLVERVVELGPSLQADSIADVIYGKTANTEKLIQLLDDCKAALEADSASRPLGG